MPTLLDSLVSPSREEPLTENQGDTGAVSGVDFPRWHEASDAPDIAAAGDTPDDHLDRLKDAKLLSLILRPVTPGAVALGREVAAEVAIWEQALRPRNRGPAGRTKLVTAVGSIVGSVLKNWNRDDPALSYRSRSKKSFDVGALVTYDQFIPAIDGLAALGFVGAKEGVRWALDLGGLPPLGDPGEMLLQEASWHHS